MAKKIKRKRKLEDEEIKSQSNEITLEDFDPLDDYTKILLLNEEQEPVKELLARYGNEVEGMEEISKEEEERLIVEYKKFEKANLREFGGYREQEGKPKRRFTSFELMNLEKFAMVMTLQDLADFYRIERESFKRMLERQPEALSVFKKGKAFGNKLVASKLIQKAMSGDLGAMIFYLKTRARWSEYHKANLSVETSGAMPSVTIEFNAEK